LLDSCPGLYFIELDVDGGSADFTSKHQVTYPNIRTLSLGRSFIDAPLKILEYISDVFPDLNALTAWTNDEDMDHPQYMLWKIVLKLWQRKLTDSHNPWYTLFGIGCDQVLMSIYSQKLDHLQAGVFCLAMKSAMSIQLTYEFAIFYAVATFKSRGKSVVL
jgi:hypothetical protein